MMIECSQRRSQPRFGSSPQVAVMPSPLPVELPREGFSARVRRPGRRAFGQRQLAAHARARCDPGFRHRRRRTSPRSSRRASGAYRVTASASSRRRGNGPSANRDSSSGHRVGWRPVPPLALPSRQRAYSAAPPARSLPTAPRTAKRPRGTPRTQWCAACRFPPCGHSAPGPAAKQHDAACKARGLLAQSRPHSLKAAVPQILEPLADRTAPSPGTTAAVLALFAASGCAALIYQVVWFEQLSLAIGSSALSLAVLLATFMGGLGLGSLLASRGTGASYAPLRRYALVELGIGVLGLVTLAAIPLLAGAYTALSGTGGLALLLRLVVAALALLPATMLMGATLPIVAPWLGGDRRGAARLGWCYAANTVGGVAGSLLAGFYLLRVHDAYVATFVAVALNIGSAAVAAALSRRNAAPSVAAAPVDAPSAMPGSGGARRIYLVTALSGMTALAAEVLWTRHLTLLLGATVYAFASIVAVFLLGIGLGSAAGAAIGRRFDPTTALGICQAAARLCNRRRRVCARRVATVLADRRDAADDGRRGAAARPAARECRRLTGGAALGRELSAGTRGRSRGRGGAAARGRPALRGQHARRHRRRARHDVRAGRHDRQPTDAAAHDPRERGCGARAAARQRASAAAPAASLAGAAAARSARGRRAHGAAAAAGAHRVRPLPADARLRRQRRLRRRGSHGVGRRLRGAGRHADLPQRRQDAGVDLPARHALAAHARPSDDARSRASAQRARDRVGRGHHRRRRQHRPGRRARRRRGARAARPGGRGRVLRRAQLRRRRATPRSRFGIDDGRHLLATTAERFDAITSDPLDPWVKGAAALYTREFWELCKARLNDGGVVTVFVQLYESTEDAVRSELATFLDVFPNGAVFANTVDGMGYDAVLVGRKSDEPIDLTRLERRLDRSDYETVAASLRAVGFDSALDLMSTLRRGRRVAGAMARGCRAQHGSRSAPAVSRGRRLERACRRRDLRRARRLGPAFPARLFTGTPAQLEELEQRLAGRQGQY